MEVAGRLYCGKALFDAIEPRGMYDTLIYAKQGWLEPMGDLLKIGCSVFGRPGTRLWCGGKLQR